MLDFILGFTFLYTLTLASVNSALFGIALTNGVYYYFYEASKSALSTDPEVPLSTIGNMTAGALGGVATSLVTNPVVTTIL